MDRFNFISYRNDSIVMPLSENELPFYFHSEVNSNQLKDLLTMFQQSSYGCYLIGGLRGSGKTSFINTFLNLLERKQKFTYSKKHLAIKVNTAQLNAHEEVITSIIESLYDLKGDKVLKNFQYEMEELHKSTLGTWRETRKETEAIKASENEVKGTIGAVKLNIQILPIQIGAGKEFKNNIEQKITKETNNEKSFESHAIDSYKLLKEIVKKLSEAGVPLIILYDELDKQDDGFLESLFKFYKEFFLEFNIFHIFCVGPSTYKKYENSNIAENALCTYFNNSHYIRSLNYEETLKYCYCMLADNYKIVADQRFYDSIGIPRLINISYLNRKCYLDTSYSDLISFAKTQLFLKLIKKFPFNQFSHEKKGYYEDCFKIEIRSLLEYLFENIECDRNDAKLYFENQKQLKFPSFDEILDVIKERDIDERVWIEDSNDRLKVSILESEIMEQLINYKQKKSLKVEDFDTIGLRRKEYGDHQLRTIKSWINGSYFVKKIGNNENSAYCNVLLRLILGNIRGLIDLILIKQRYEGSGYRFKHSLVAAIEIGGLEYLYYNEAGSYEPFENCIDEVEESLKEYGIKWRVWEEDDEKKPVEEIIEEIVNFYS